MQLVTDQPGAPERPETAAGVEQAPLRKRPALRPLLSLAPYLVRHKAMLGAALVALIVSAAATLAVPLAVSA